MIGFIGLGVMGEPICRHLASKGGERVVAYDLRPEPLGRPKQHGVKAAVAAGHTSKYFHVVAKHI